MFRGGAEIQQPKIAWRRSDLGEAFQSACTLFTILMVSRILWHAVAGTEADYQNAFLYASCFGVGYGLSSLVFKTKMVVLR